MPLSSITGEGGHPDPSPGRVVLNADEIGRILTRMAHELLEANNGADGLVLLGIPTRGVPLAGRLAAVLSQVEGRVVPHGQLDITMYRDDLRSQPTRPVGRTVLPAEIEGGLDEVTVVLVDDVLFSGRTVVAALDALHDLGRPRAVRLAVLVDRGHRQVPIRADHVGKNLPTSGYERVQVRLAETDGLDEVTISRPRSDGDGGYSASTAGTGEENA